MENDFKKRGNICNAGEDVEELELFLGLEISWVSPLQKPAIASYTAKYINTL